MRSSDALIIGAGPAGIAAAIALRQHGADVLVADARHPPIDKPCGEGLMPEAVHALFRLGISLQPGDGSTFHGIAFVSDTIRAQAHFSRGHGLGVRRTVLQRLLFNRANELGVRFAWDAPALLRQGQPLTLAGVPVQYRWLIGADGHASRVRAWVGLERGSIRSRRFGFRAHYRFESGLPHVEVHWGKRGQAYLTPVGPQEICVSAMTRDPHLRLSDVLASIPSLSARFPLTEQTTAERGCLTLTRRLRRVTRDNVALIGDASGSADAITGEGLALAFRHALLLAESLRNGSLDLYQQRHSPILALPQRMSDLLLLLDRNPRLRDRTLGIFAARPALFHELLAVHTGEQPMQRFILRHGPALGALLLSPRVA
jgi:flavin-dependent dehydrogenase